MATNKHYNYTISEKYEKKIYIPWFNVEIKGWKMIFMMLGIVIVGGLLLSLPFQLFMDTQSSLMLGIALGCIIAIGLVTYLSEVDTKKGKSNIEIFFYTKIKRHRHVVVSGQKKIIGKKRMVVNYIDL